MTNRSSAINPKIYWYIPSKKLRNHTVSTAHPIAPTPPTRKFPHLSTFLQAPAAIYQNLDHETPCTNDQLTTRRQYLRGLCRFVDGRHQCFQPRSGLDTYISIIYTTVSGYGGLLSEDMNISEPYIRDVVVQRLGSSYENGGRNHGMQKRAWMISGKQGRGAAVLCTDRGVHLVDAAEPEHGGYQPGIRFIPAPHMHRGPRGIQPVPA